MTFKNQKWSLRKLQILPIYRHLSTLKLSWYFSKIPNFNIFIFLDMKMEKVSQEYGFFEPILWTPAERSLFISMCSELFPRTWRLRSAHCDWLAHWPCTLVVRDPNKNSFKKNRAILITVKAKIKMELLAYCYLISYDAKKKIKKKNSFVSKLPCDFNSAKLKVYSSLCPKYKPILKKK